MKEYPNESIWKYLNNGDLINIYIYFFIRFNFLLIKINNLNFLYEYD